MRLASGEKRAFQTHQLWPLKVCSSVRSGEVPEHGRLSNELLKQLLAIGRELDADHAVGVTLERLFELCRFRRRGCES